MRTCRTFSATLEALPRRQITSAPCLLNARCPSGGSKETMIATPGQTRWSLRPPASVIAWKAELIGQIPGTIILCSWSSITT